MKLYQMRVTGIEFMRVTDRGIYAENAGVKCRLKNQRHGWSELQGAKCYRGSGYMAESVKLSPEGSQVIRD